jgi:hypothetical protein
MANVVRDPKDHPEAIIPDLTKPDPLLTFTKDDIAFVYGSIWKQRYFKKVGDDYFPLPAQWDVTHKIWRAYFVRAGTDWWVPFYPADNMKRPTGPLCDGCHSVNFNIRNNTVTEWNVGCEKCHGPGSEHTRTSFTNIANWRVTTYANDKASSAIRRGASKNPTRARLRLAGGPPPQGLKDSCNQRSQAGRNHVQHFAATGTRTGCRGNDFVARHATRDASCRRMSMTGFRQNAAC